MEAELPDEMKTVARKKSQNHDPIDSRKDKVNQHDWSECHAHLEVQNLQINKRPPRPHTQTWQR